MKRIGLACVIALGLSAATLVRWVEAAEVVEVLGGEDGFVYLVDGVPTSIRGMGYNAPLSALSADQRAARIRRDFALMRQAGVNTVVGWDQVGFDRDLFDAADQHGLGVIAHLELPRGADYSDPAVRAGLLRRTEEWVLAYREHPALRLWGPGNEVLLTASDEEVRAFADFYVELFKLIRRLDPRHPVVYREAEDVRVPAFRAAFAEAGVPMHGFVYGLNFYTPRLARVLEAWPVVAGRVPVFVSEFAPAGVAPSVRASAYRDLFAILRRHEAIAIGAAPYAWTTDGPEAVDRIFGLVDGDGSPIDGGLAEVQRNFRGAHAFAEPIAVPPPRNRLEDLRVESLIARALARGLARADAPLDVDAAQAKARGRYRSLVGEYGSPADRRYDRTRIDRTLALVADAAVLAEIRTADGPLYPGAREALPLLAGMARWAATDPAAESVAADFLGEVLAQALAN